MSKKQNKPFGGYNISFEDCHETMEQIFGKEELSPPIMIKKLWTFIKKHKLAGFD